MKKIILSLAIIAITIVSALGQNVVVKNYNFNNITGVDANYTYKVTATKGNSNKIEVICPDYLKKYIKITSSNGILNLSVNLPKNFKSPYKSSSEIKVKMEMQSINLVRLSGASSFRSEGSFTTTNMTYDLSGASKVNIPELSGQYLKVDCSGASGVTHNGNFNKMDLDCSGATNIKIIGNIGEIDADISGATQINYEGKSTNIGIDASGASKVMLKGNTGKLEIGISGASYVNAKEMIAQDVYVDASGASKASVYSNNILKAEASAASSVSYYGEPKQIITKPTNIRRGN